MYDGGDCCLAVVNTTQCTECKCISEEDEFDPCPLGGKIGDGACDLSNNNTICSFDGGDCSRLSIQFFLFYLERLIISFLYLTIDTDNA